MAKVQKTVTRIERDVTRPGIHAKTRTSSKKGARNYRKAYRGQGR